jgi:ActD protein
VTRVVASFDSPQAVERAIAASQRIGGRAISVCSPAFDPTLLQLVGATRSPVAAWALASGLAGIVGGFLLTIGTVQQWPGLIVGGKPLVAMPTLLIIVFELAILCASIGAAIGFLMAARRARQSAGLAGDPSTTDSRFTLLVESPVGLIDTGRLLSSVGAVEWRPV